jgi:hypothetical protein
VASSVVTNEEDNMSPRKPTVDDLDDVDDEDGIVEEELSEKTDLDLTVRNEGEAGLGGLPSDAPEEEER